MKKIYPGPAIKSLENAGWKKQVSMPDMHHNVYLMVSPQDQDRYVQFRGREKSVNSAGQYLFGIFYDDFDSVHVMVLWALCEKVMLALPTVYLKKIFDPDRAKIDTANRWHVNVYFERYGNAEIVPVSYGETYNVNNYIIPFKA